MKHIVCLLILIVCSSYVLNSQGGVRYFKDKSFTIPTKKPRARYSIENKLLPNGKLVEERRYIQGNCVLSCKADDGEPYGKWKVDGKIYDYDFELNYEISNCINSKIGVDYNYSGWDSVQINYKAPSYKGGILEYVFSNVNFPEYTIENEISGEIELILYIGKEGGVEDVFIAKGINKAIDKEAARVYRSMKFTPAEFEGNRIGVFVLFSCIFE